MNDMGIVDGLEELGYQREDIPALVQGTLPQVGCALMPLLFYCLSQNIISPTNQSSILN